MSLISGAASSGALDALRAQGMTIVRKPEYDIPALPRDITKIGDEDLMVLYSELTAYADFVSVQVSCAQTDERAAERKLSAQENFKMLSSGGKSENRVTFARAQVAADPEIIALKDDLERQYAYRKLIEAMAANIERDAALVSRELTRRTNTLSRRSNRWGN